MTSEISIIKIIERTLNYVEPRLINHGKRVAYLAYRAMKRFGKYDESYTKKMAVLALLHDIGAYKTEEVNNMFRFETEAAHEHAAYGSLFIKYFSPLADLSPVVLYHHANCREVEAAPPFARELAQIIHIADRIDVLLQSGMMGDDLLYRYFEGKRGTGYYSNLVDLFFGGGWRRLTDEMEGDEAFAEILYDTSLTPKGVEDYTKMIVLSIDFRSPQTVTHTFTTASAGSVLARFIGVGEARAAAIYKGMLLHDIGKIGVPREIIEKPDKLTDQEMAVMKTHVNMTRSILSGYIEDDIMEMAVRHHEKLDGSGYPRGLQAEQLTMEQRAVAVADIFSALCSRRTYKDAYPKETVIRILKEMADDRKIDAMIVDIACRRYDALMQEIERTNRPIVAAYERMQAEYTATLAQMTGKPREHVAAPMAVYSAPHCQDTF